MRDRRVSWFGRWWDNIWSCNVSVLGWGIDENMDNVAFLSLWSSSIRYPACCDLFIASAKFLFRLDLRGSRDVLCNSIRLGNDWIWALKQERHGMLVTTLANREREPRCIVYVFSLVVPRYGATDLLAKCRNRCRCLYITNLHSLNNKPRG